MQYAKRCGVMLAICAAVALVGCGPKMDMEKLKEMQPQRPAELDLLNMWVGHWVGEGEMEMKGMEEEVTMRGESSISWDCDNWVLTEKGKFSMADMDPMTGTGMWAYDSKAKKFRMCWMDSSGGASRATAKYDPETRTWKMKGHSHTPCGKTTGRGKSVFIDDDTIEWEWAEYTFLGLIKVMEFEGTSRRQ
jgi:hypothetical protein